MKNITTYLGAIGLMIFLLGCTSENGLNIIREMLPFILHMMITSGLAFVVLYAFLMILDEDGTKKAFFNLKNIRKYLGAIGLMVFLLVCVSVSKQNTMEGILPYITHMLIISGTIFMVLYTLLMVIDGNNTKEVLFRSITIVLSSLIYYISIIFDISVSDLIIQSLEKTKPVTIIMVRFILPLIFGVVIAYFINSIFNNKNIIATRIIIMLSALIIILFIDTYAAVMLSVDTSVDTSVAFSSVTTSTKLLPNASFVIGLILCVILGYRNDVNNKNIATQYDNLSAN